MPTQSPIQITAPEARTRLSELLRRVSQGKRFVITLRGRVVAELGQPGPAEESPARRQYTDEEREAAYQCLRNPQIHGISNEEVLERIREGRR